MAYFILFAIALQYAALFGLYVMLKRTRAMLRDRYPQPAHPHLWKIPTTFYVPGPQEQEEDPCVICLEDYEPGVELRVFPCRHRFHRTCSDNWLLVAPKLARTTEHVKPACPICKQVAIIEPV